MNPTGNETLRISVLVIIRLGGFLPPDSFVFFFLGKGLTYDACGFRNLILGEHKGFGEEDEVGTGFHVAQFCATRHCSFPPLSSKKLISF